MAVDRFLSELRPAPESPGAPGCRPTPIRPG